MAFIFESKDDAGTALQETDPALVPDGTFVERDHESGLWGWKDIGADDTASEPAIDPADLPAKEGDVVLQLGGPVTLDAETREALAKIARKCGMTLIVRDAFSFVENERIKGGTKSAKVAGSAIERDERGLTHQQAIMVDLMLREEGATNAELMAAGASTATTSINWLYQTHQVTKATKGRYARAMSILREIDGREVKGFRIREVPEEGRAAVLAAAIADLESKGQGAKRKPKDAANDAANANSNAA